LNGCGIQTNLMAQSFEYLQTAMIWKQIAGVLPHYKLKRAFRGRGHGFPVLSFQADHQLVELVHAERSYSRQILTGQCRSWATNVQGDFQLINCLESRVSGNFDSRLTIGPNALFGGPLRDLIEFSPGTRPSRRQSLSLKPEFVYGSLADSQGTSSVLNGDDLESELGCLPAQPILARRMVSSSDLWKTHSL
jgi:hypothetical protein